MDHLGSQWRAEAREQFDIVLDRIDAAWNGRFEENRRQAADLARTQISETLNQGLRRLRQSETVESAAVLAAEIAASFAERCAVFLFHNNEANAAASRGLGPLPLSLSPDDGAAFRTCVDTQDPVIAMATDAEISQSLARRVGTDQTDRVFLLPLIVRRQVKAILFSAGAVQHAPLELIGGITAMQMESLTPPTIQKAENLVSIQDVRPSKEPVKGARMSWTDLAPPLQALHLKAQRDARLRVAEIRLEHGAALRSGLERSDIYDALREPIDAARSSFRRDHIEGSPSMVDYLYLEIVRGLAYEDDRLLGPQFPGPLV